MTAVAMSEFERGLAAQRSGRPEDAIAAYRAAVAADPRLAPAYFNLGQMLRNRHDLPNAAQAFDAAVRLRPTAADAWINLGVCREGLGDLDTALTCYREASRLDPRFAGAAHFNAGNVLRKQGDLPAAIASFEAARAVTPEAPEIWLNLGNACREDGRLAEAMAALERAGQLKPDWPEARWNLALAQLAAGRLAEGWAGYRSRFARERLTEHRGLPWPIWRGEPLADRRILVWREQGLGDEIMFATCVPDLVALGADVTLAVDPRLVGLYQRSLPEVRVVPDGAFGPGGWDFQVPIGNLPEILRGSRADFRPRWSYLMPARAQLAAWSERLRGLGPGPRVGICWRSALRGGERARYYPTLTQWLRVLEIPGAVFVNLQYDDCEAELVEAEQAAGIRIHRWAGVDLRDDLESVAGLMWHLDLVITAPTAVSSLAGALGTETWQLDPGTDWTVFGEDRSPWFPAIRLFRRDEGDRTWHGALDRVASELRERIGHPFGATRQGEG